MNFKFAEIINPYLQIFDFNTATKIAENELKQLAYTDFHFVIGKTLLEQVDELADWINKYFLLASQKINIGALYFEMNEFDINTNMWFIDGFSYSNDMGNNTDDIDWLCDFDTDTQTETNSVFKIDGFEKLQIAFAEIKDKKISNAWNKEMQDARDLCEQLVIIKFMELIRTAHLSAREKDLPWSKVPIYCTEHEYDFILKSQC